MQPRGPRARVVADSLGADEFSLFKDFFSTTLILINTNFYAKELEGARGRVEDVL